MKSALRVRVPRSNARFRDTQFDPNNARHTSRDLDGLAYQGLANAAPTVFGPNVESPNSRTRSGRPNQTVYPDQVRIEHSNDDRSIFRGSGREALVERSQPSTRRRPPVSQKTSQDPCSAQVAGSRRMTRRLRRSTHECAT
jgi:hypothetical protein